MAIDVVPCQHRACVDIIDSRGPDGDPLHLTAAEWLEFISAVKAGQYDDVLKAADPL